MAENYTPPQVAQAIAMAVPIVMLDRYGDLNHCLDAAAVGTLILRRFGFPASPVAVDAVVVRVTDDTNFARPCRQRV